jgi:hypothetical protein
VLTDSELPLLLIAKLTYFFVSLPDQLPLVRNKNKAISTIDQKEENMLQYTNLLEQLE